MSGSADTSAGDDLARLSAWLTANVPGFHGPVEMRPFDAGQSNPTYELRTPERSYVLRRKPPGRLLSSAHAVDREYRVLAALHPAGLPVPRPYALCEDDAIIGSMFYVMEKAEGRMLRDPLLPGISPEDRGAIYRSMVSTLAGLHNVDLAACGLEDFGRPGNYMARQVERWTKQYRASADREIPDMERLIEWLPRTIPPQTRTTLIHGDYKVDNVVFHATEPRVAAVLDWELATTGEPICDLTYLLMNWANGPIADLADPAGEGFPSRAELEAQYCQLTGRDGLPELDWFFSYNMFRLAAIIEGIVGRVRDGTARDPQAAALAVRTPMLAAAAWRFAQRAGA
ncbi:phosphotransferase family protein [uncultured Phenylobacterium sp.]|uniref:phosphotransferase family protein n=1 Tax=uncultured Phenylobacterium sp. TaxID=349273 RepID=UPI0025FCD727|nr:phosphotransferase family protein [uncultured Phenylobacterium sp.]